jgi:hypothetical protein
MQDFRKHKSFTRVHAALIAAAQERRLLTYPDVAAIMGLPGSGNDMGKKVGAMGLAINRFEQEAGRPMLSALIVRTGTRTPGEGYYVCAAQLGGTTEFGDDGSKRAYWESERDKVYAEWAS